MAAHFPDIVDLKFTANMEEKLDSIAQGQSEWRAMLTDFYPAFHGTVERAQRGRAHGDHPGAAGARALDRLGPTLYNFYGATETGLVTTATPDDLRAVMKQFSAVTPAIELLAGLAKAGIDLDRNSFVRFSHWMPPEAEIKRFSTWFFVARAPHLHDVAIDEGEIVDHAWVRPEEMFERRERGIVAGGKRFGSGGERGDGAKQEPPKEKGEDGRDEDDRGGHEQCRGAKAKRG